MSAQRYPSIRFHLHNSGRCAAPLPVELSFCSDDVLGEFRTACASHAGVPARHITSIVVHHQGSECAVETAEDVLGLLESSIVSVQAKPLVRKTGGYQEVE